MGHLTLLAEDVISALDRFPFDLQSLIYTSYTPQPEWEEYVKGRYSETKRKDRLVLGGPKPSSSMSSSGFSGSSFGEGIGVETKAPGGGVGRMAVDEAAMFPGLRLDETNADTFTPRSSSKGSLPKIEIEQGDIEGITIGIGDVERKADVPEDVGSSLGRGGSGEVRGEFRRIGFDGGSRSPSGRTVSTGVRNTADFGPPVVGGPEDEEDEDDEEKYGNSRTTHVSQNLVCKIPAKLTLVIVC
jgi:hypothetical protein